MSLRRRTLLGSMAAAAAWNSSLVQASAPNSQPIRMLVGFPPGGGTDAIARFLMEHLRTELGQPIVIENRPGIGGRLAFDALKAAVQAQEKRPTFLFAPNASPTFQELVYKEQLRYDLWKDFVPVAGVVSYPLAMGVSTSLGVNTIAEFIEWCKKHPNQSCYGVPGLGGQNFFLGYRFAKQAGIQLPAAAYKGTPPVITDLIGGHIPAAITLLEDLRRPQQTGKVKLIGVFSDERSPLEPSVPSFKESGFDVTSAEAWSALWAPNTLPVEEVERMRTALNKVLAKPEVQRALLSNLSVKARYLDGPQMEKAQRDEIETWRPIVKASGYQPNE